MSIHMKRYFALKRVRHVEKSYWTYYLEAHLQHKKEMCMSPRQMKIYWEEPNMDVSPACCYSRFLKYKHSVWSHMLKRKKVTHITQQ